MPVFFTAILLPDTALKWEVLVHDEPSLEIVRDQLSDRLLAPESEPVERSETHMLLRRQAFWFGPFRFLPAQQLLLRHGTPVRIGGRALEVLMALVERPGLLVTKSELMARAWPTTFVDESNLKVQICCIRRALGDGRNGDRFLATVAGRGYRFVAPVAVRAVDMGEPLNPVLRARVAQLEAPSRQIR